MKKICSVIAIIFIMSFFVNVLCYAETYDFANMTLDELNNVKSLIDKEIDLNHYANSDQRASIDKVTKSYVEDKYGKDNVDWAWFDYTYTRDWDFYTLKTHADIRKHDGGKAQYDVYSELFEVNGVYRLVYLTIGTEVLIDLRSQIIDDPRILKQLGINDSSNPVTRDEETKQSDVKGTEEIIIAQRGDHNDDVVSIQEFLKKLGYFSGKVDGSFGGGTEKAVKQFQTDYGFTDNGIVTKDVYNAMKKAADSAPEPKKVIKISAEKLYKAFDDNSIAAEEKYKGKLVQVSGKIDSIDESFWGTPYVRLKADDYGFTSVTCYFSSSDKSELASLQKNQSITIEGTCGSMSLLDVDVQNCTIIK